MNFQRVFSLLLLLSLQLIVVPSFALRNFYQVTDGIYRGAQPDGDVDYAELKNKYGIKTIVNLRWDDSVFEEEVETSKPYGFKLHHYRMHPFVKLKPQYVSNIIAVIMDPANQPVFVHCKAGKDRTGTIMGLIRVHQMGWNADDAYTEMKALGFNSYFFMLRSFFKTYSKPNALPPPNNFLFTGKGMMKDIPTPRQGMISDVYFE